MKITLLLLVLGVCLASAKYLPFDSEDSNGLLLRNKRSDSEESNSSVEHVSNESNDNDDGSKEKKMREMEKKRLEREEKLKKKLEEQQEKEKRREEERRHKEEERKKKLEAKQVEEERKEQERLDKAERKRQEKLEKEKHKLEEQKLKEEEKRIKQEKKRQEKLLHELRKEAFDAQSQDDSFLETEEENSVEMEDIWRSHIYMKYGLTLASTNLEKQAALDKYIQEELGLKPNYTKSERRQAIINLIQTKLQNDTAAIEAIRLQVLSRLNPITLQGLRNEMDKDIEDINNKTDLLKNVSLPWAASVQQTLDEKRTFLQTISQFMANIIPNWFSGNNTQSNASSSTETNIVHGVVTDGSVNDASVSQINEGSNSNAVDGNSQSSPNNDIAPGLINVDAANPIIENNDPAQSSSSSSGIVNEGSHAVSGGDVPSQSTPSNSNAGSEGIASDNGSVLADDNNAPSSPLPIPSVENSNGVASLANSESNSEVVNNEANINKPIGSIDPSQEAVSDTSLNNGESAGINQQLPINTPSNIGTIENQGVIPLENGNGNAPANQEGVQSNNNLNPNGGQVLGDSNSNGNSINIQNDVTEMVTENLISGATNIDEVVGSDSIASSQSPLIENEVSVSQSISNDVNDVATVIPPFENKEDSTTVPNNAVVSPVADSNNIKPENNEQIEAGSDLLNGVNNVENNAASSNIASNSPAEMVPESINNAEGSGQVPEAIEVSGSSSSTVSSQVLDSSNIGNDEIPSDSGATDLGVSSSDFSNNNVQSDASSTNAQNELGIATEPVLINKNESVSAVPVDTLGNKGSDSGAIDVTTVESIGDVNNEQSTSTVSESSSNIDAYVTTQDSLSTDITTEAENLVEVASNQPVNNIQVNEAQNTLVEENIAGVSNTVVSNIEDAAVTEQGETIAYEVTDAVALELEAVTDNVVTEKEVSGVFDVQTEQSSVTQDINEVLDVGTTESVVNTPENILETFTLANEPGATVVEVVTQ